MLFTTSWDDGYALDMRVAALLSTHGLTGTFYVSPKDQHMERLLTKEQLLLIAKDHEIGAHTVNHPHLTRLDPRAAMEEIAGSKRWVEERTGNACTSFCYPYGDWNPAVRTMVQEAGYTSGRTTEELRFDSNDPFIMPTSLQVYPFPWRPACSRWWHPLDPLGRLRKRYGRLRALDIPHRAMTSWLSLAIALFDKALETDQHMFHLWGHSHEVEKYGMWGDLDALLAHVHASGVRCITNGELARTLHV